MFGNHLLTNSWQVRQSSNEILFCFRIQSPEMNVSEILMKIFCLLGLGWQVYELSFKYFQYDVTSSVKVQFSDHMDYPVVSICVLMFDLLKMDVLEKMHPENYDSLRKLENAIMTRDQKLKFLNQLMSTSHVDSLFRMTSSSREVFSSCRILNSSYLVQRSKCSNFFNITESISREYKCFTFRPKDSFRLVYDTNRVLRSLRWGYIMGIYIDKAYWITNDSSDPLMESARVSMHDFDEESTVGTEYFLNCNPIKAIFRFSLIQSTSQLLPKPFTTDCRDYQADGLVSQAECFNQCFKRVTIKDFGQYPYGPAVIQEKNVRIYKKMMTSEQLKKEPSLYGKVLNQSIICDGICSKNDCILRNMVPILLMKSIAYPYNVFHFFMSRSREISTGYQEEVNLYTFVTSIGSVLGFWIGFAMINLSEVIQKYVEFMKKKHLQDLIKQREQARINRMARIMVELDIDVQLRNQIIQDMMRRLWSLYVTIKAREWKFRLPLNQTKHSLIHSIQNPHSEVWIYVRIEPVVGLLKSVPVQCAAWTRDLCVWPPLVLVVRILVLWADEWSSRSGNLDRVMVLPCIDQIGMIWCPDCRPTNSDFWPFPARDPLVDDLGEDHHDWGTKKKKAYQKRGLEVT